MDNYLQMSNVIQVKQIALFIMFPQGNAIKLFSRLLSVFVKFLHFIFFNNHVLLAGATSPTPRPCLPGKDVTYCFFDPCRIATCHSFPEATCSSDHCGGCNAVFTNRNGIVLTKEECQEGIRTSSNVSLSEASFL